MTLYTSDWSLCGTDYFERLDVYKMKWGNGGQDLRRVVTAVCPYSALIAVLRRTTERKARVVFIYSASGQPISKFEWKGGDMLGIEWSLHETLLCIQADGRVFQYNIFGEMLDSATLSMGAEAQELGVKDWRVFESYSGTTGIVVLTGANRFYIVNSVQEPKIWRMSEIERRDAPSLWTIVSRDRQTHIMACYGAEMFRFSQGQQPELIVLPFSTPVKSYSAMCCSPQKDRVALISDNGLAQVATIDLYRSIREVDTRIRQSPDSVFWCGNDAVVCRDESQLLLFSVISESGSVSFDLDDQTIVAQDIDCLRLISGSRHESLSPVCKERSAVLSVGSTSYGALLFEAHRSFLSKSYKAYDYLRLIEGDIPEAVNECVLAALDAYRPAVQKALIDAACFGKMFEPAMPSEEYVNACQRLRVLNALRAPIIAMPLTHAQFEAITLRVLVDRLIGRQQWPLAVSICDFLALPSEFGQMRVLTQWALFQITRRSSSDEEVAASIMRRFGDLPEMPYARVAVKASELKRDELAFRLLQCEPNVHNQVDVYMKLGFKREALQRAVEVGDPEHIMFVILTLRSKSTKKADFDILLRSQPVAFDLYKQHCREAAPEQLLSLFQQEDDHAAQALVHLQHCGNATVFDTTEKIDALKQAEKCFLADKDEASARLAADSAKLIGIQEELEEKLGISLGELTLRETLIKLLGCGETARAETIRRDLKVADKQWTQWRIEGLATAQHWDELDTLLKSKKIPPTMWLNCVDAAVRTGSAEQAKRFIPRGQSDVHVKALIKMGQLAEAATMAYELRSEDMLRYVLARCGPANRGVSDHVRTLHRQLLEKR